MLSYLVSGSFSIVDFVMDYSSATDTAEIISFNETLTVWKNVEVTDQDTQNISEPNPILPAYIAYTSFVLFRYGKEIY